MADPKAPRSRRRDFWQLDLPLIVVLGLCVSATVIEVGRAGAGNWRAAVYSIEWPIIGAFAIWMWIRFKREGGSFRGITQRWQDRVAQYEAEAAAQDQDPHQDPADGQSRPASTSAAAAEDPELRAWRAYQADVRRRDQSQAPD